jgi:hypothetical protein
LFCHDVLLLLLLFTFSPGTGAIVEATAARFERYSHVPSVKYPEQAGSIRMNE